MNNLETLATAMSEAGEEFGSATPYGSLIAELIIFILHIIG